MARTQSPARCRTEQYRGEEITVTIDETDPEYAVRVQLDGPSTWVVGVDGEGCATPLATTDGADSAAAMPAWARTVLRNLGVVHIDSGGS